MAAEHVGERTSGMEETLHVRQPRKHPHEADVAWGANFMKQLVAQVRVDKLVRCRAKVNVSPYPCLVVQQVVSSRCVPVR